jgi:hypothetical protein
MEESKSTQDTPENKLIEGNILIMDVNSIPKEMGMDIDKWAHLIREQGVVFYDSTKGEAPRFADKVECGIVAYDVNSEEAMVELTKILEDDEYDPELPEKILVTPTPIEENTILGHTLDMSDITINNGTTTTTHVNYTNGSNSGNYIMGIDPISEGNTTVGYAEVQPLSTEQQQNIADMMGTLSEEPQVDEIGVPNHIPEGETVTVDHGTYGVEGLSIDHSPIDEVMTRRRRQLEPGFELTDDTE